MILPVGHCDAPAKDTAADSDSEHPPHPVTADAGDADHREKAAGAPEENVDAVTGMRWLWMRCRIPIGV